MPTQPEELRARTKEFAIRIVRLFRSLPKNDEARIIGNQVLRAGTSVAANYRATCRARSRAEFVAKLGLVAEEADESLFWLDFAAESKLLTGPELEMLRQEAGELLAIFSASLRTARQNRK